LQLAVAVGSGQWDQAVLHIRSDAQSLNRSVDIIDLNTISDDFEKLDALDNLERPVCLFAKKTCATEVSHVI